MLSSAYWMRDVCNNHEHVQYLNEHSLLWMQISCIYILRVLTHNSGGTFNLSALLLLTDKHRIRTDAPVVDLGPASLGTSCLTDSQCQMVDPHTRCLNKRCDCAYRTNSTSACSARNRGCLPGTFQVSTMLIFLL